MQDAEFEQFVRDREAKALRLAHSFLGDWEEARDAAQEAFVKAYRKQERFRGESSFDTWFCRILANHCRDRLRRRRVRAWLTFEGLPETDGVAAASLDRHPDPTPGPHDQLEGQAFRRDLRRALKRLPARQREVFRLKAVAGLTVAETARILGISEGATKSHFFRATRALQSALGSWRDTS